MSSKATIDYKGQKYYSTAEERLNIATHGLGFLASLLGLALLTRKAWEHGGILEFLSFAAFGLSMVLLYAASTAYHSARPSRLRYRLNILDHAAIFVLIAGTYTPFTLVTLQGQTGWAIFIAVWAIALAGVVLKLFYTGKYDRLSTLMYVAMGWIIILAINPLIRALPGEGLYWLMAGGISYTVGAVLYSIKKIPFNHAIFHVFVLGGTFCHFWTVYFYVLGDCARSGQ